MDTFKIVVEYDGSRYKGYKKTKKGSAASIQEKIEAVLCRLENRDTITLQAAVATEPGVHSMGQVLSYRTEKEFTSQTIETYMNKYLPQDIAVRMVKKARDNFHAEFSKSGICYAYRIQTGPYQNVMEQQYMEYREEALDLTAIRNAMDRLTGIVDMAVFNGNPKLKKSTIRKVDSFRIQVDKNEIKLICIVDDVFMGMMQAIFGTLLQIGTHEMDLQEFYAKLEELKSGSLYILAPAKALTLVQVYYDEKEA